MPTVLENPTVAAPAKAIAERISFEEFLARYSDGSHVEWVDGEVIPMAAASLPHFRLTLFLATLLKRFTKHHALGEIAGDPYVMKLGPGLPGRAPDVAFVATAHLALLHTNFLDGPADLVIEVVSPDNPDRDYITKFQEYEAAGVLEYWIVDQRLQQARFYQLQDGKYHEVLPDENGIYHSAQLPGLWLKVEWLWQDPLPDEFDVFRQWKLI